MDVDALRAQFHDVVDELLDRFERETPPSVEGDLIIKKEDAPFEVPWHYRWPSDQEEPYTKGSWYRIWTPTEMTARLLVAQTMRWAWGANRGRVVIFRQLGDIGSRTFYPWTEFVQSDDGKFGAIVPDPKHPRASLYNGSAIPGGLDSARLRRSDELFRSIQDGPSLRYVVTDDEVEEMIRFAYWVASTRGRFNG